jgi:hypothetical protein
MTTRNKGLLIATAALGLMAGGAGIASAGEEGKVKCAGINGCAGKGECAAADGSHECGGHNSCKGKGWVYVDSAEECRDQGGTVQE